MMQAMDWMKHQNKYENLTYVVLWVVLLIAPVLSIYIQTDYDAQETFSWQLVFRIWMQYALYLVIFLIHNFLVAPLLVYKQRRMLYFSIIFVLIALFQVYQCSSRPDRPGRPHMALHHDQKHGPHAADDDRMGPPDFDDHFDDDFVPSDDEWLPDHKPDGERPPFVLGEPEIMAGIILVLMLGMNLGIKLYFKSRQDQKQLNELEKKTLEQQLEYLKYQINPHFFMNTLNNIHALVDIDPERAKQTILELSKMMRFVLYESDKQGVPLSREFDFISNYITLMRLRYTDKVKIDVSLPTEAPDGKIPPLMLISFVENAFKHGISYQRDSFVTVRADIDGQQLHFLCRNSKTEATDNKKHGGVGLANVRQRLKLIYGSSHTLHIQDEADIYQVDLTIPITL